MKLLLTLSLFITTICHAQPEGWAVEDIGQTHYSICKSKNKVGIYSRAKGNFLAPPHKGHVLHLPQPQFLLDVYPNEEKLIIYHYYGGNIQKLEPENDTAYLMLGHIMASQWNTKLQMSGFSSNRDGTHQDWNLLSFSQSDDANMNAESFFSYEFVGSFLNVNLNHTNTREDMMREVKSIQFPEQDSIDMDANTVYYPRDEMNIYNSGCFNLKTGQWDILPEYEGVNSWEGIYAAYYWPTYDYEVGYANKELTGTGIVYDFYKLQDKSLQPTEFMNRQKFAFPLELWPYEDEHVWYDPDSIYVYHEGKKGVGLYQIALSGKDLSNGYSLDWYASRGRFEVVELMKPEYESIFISGDMNFRTSPYYNKNIYALGAKGEDAFDIYFFNELRSDISDWDPDTLVEDVVIKSSIKIIEANFWVSDTARLENHEHIAIVDGKKTIRYCPFNGEIPEHTRYTNVLIHSGEGSSKFKTLIEGNGIYAVTANQFEDESDWIPLRSMVDAWDDSLDADGNTLYYAPDPGNYHSGIYNGNTNAWELTPENIQVFPTNGGYVIEKPVTNENGILEKAYFDLQMPNGSFKFQDVIHTQFDNPTYDKYKIEGYKIDGIKYIGERESRLAYFYTMAGVGVARFNSYTADILVHPKQMVKHAANRTFVYLNNDTLYFKVHESKDRYVRPIGLAFPMDTNVNVALDSYYTPRKKGKDYSDTQHNGAHRASKVNLHIADSLTEKEYLLDFIYDQHGFSIDTLLLQKDAGRKAKSANSKFNSISMGMEGEYWEFEFSIFDGHYIYIRDNLADNKDEWPYESQIYWGEDSMDVEGNIVYHPPIPGYYSSGVYDTETKNWFIAPEYMAVQWVSGNTFLLHKAARSEEEGLMVGSQFILKQGDKETILKDVIHDSQVGEFAVGKINDSLIIINDIKEEQLIEPYESTYYPDEDSLDSNGNTVYREAVPGEYKSGIFNVYTNEWVVNASCAYVYLIGDAVIAETPILDKNGMLTGMSYAIFSLNGRLLKDKLSITDLEEAQQKRIKSSHWN